MYYKFDNATNGIKTVYGFVRDAAGKVSPVKSKSIIFDNVSPTIDNMTYRDELKLWFAPEVVNTPYSGKITLHIQAHDNATALTTPTVTGNFSSGFKDFYLAYKIVRGGATMVSGDLGATDDNISSVSETSWTPFTDFIDNATNDNVTTNLGDSTYKVDYGPATFPLQYVMDFASNNTTFTTKSNFDNLTVVLYLRDNASNISGNFTTTFTLDNSTVYSAADK
jgi:hypothetical protein